MTKLIQDGAASMEGNAMEKAVTGINLRPVANAKCAVSDFDRTLYVNGEISWEDIQAVRRWQEAGNWFVIATGRNESGLKEKLFSYGCRPDAYILNNGARVLLADGRELYCKTIDDSTAQAVLHYLDEHSLDGCGVSLRSRKINILSAANTTTQKPCGQTITIGQAAELRDIVQIHTRRPDDVAWTVSLCQKLNRRFPGISAYANVWNADIMAHGVDKAAGITHLIGYTGDFAQILTIGDSENDVGMIRQYKGAAVDWACENARQAAAHIVSSVAEYLAVFTSQTPSQTAHPAPENG